MRAYLVSIARRITPGLILGRAVFVAIIIMVAAILGFELNLRLMLFVAVVTFVDAIGDGIRESFEIWQRYRIIMKKIGAEG